MENLVVTVPPSVQVNSNADVTVVGDAVTLVCKATGNPPPSIRWNKGELPVNDEASGVHLSHDGTHLNIERLKSHNAGNYTCVARNEAGSAESTVLLDVFVPPLIDRDLVNVSPRLPTGQSLTLSCNASGSPEPVMKW
ncbi:immunoglobulin I-set domain protein [Cooperia oncophora]